MKSKNKKGSAGVGVITGLVLAGVAGAYFLYGTKEGKKQRKKITSLALRAKGEVLEKMEKLKDVNQDSYNKIVSGVIQKYKKLKSDHQDEIEKVSSELVSYWKHLKKHLENVEKSSKKNKKISKK